MFRPYTMAELIRLSDEQLIAAYDVAIEQTIVGADYYLSFVLVHSAVIRSRPFCFVSY